MKVSNKDKIREIADKYNITLTTANEIVDRYVVKCMYELLIGKRVEIQGLVNIVPQDERGGYVSTLAYMSKEIATEFGIPYNTVYYVLRDFIDGIKDDIMNGNDTEIRCLVQFHPVTKPNGDFTVHSNVSSSLATKVATPLRVHTHKLFRYQIRKLNYAN